MASLKRTVLRTAMAVLFSVILLIPRLRRLRRSVRVWTAIRIAFVAGGAWLLWRVSILGPNELSAQRLAPGIVLVLFGALVRARPLKKPVDAVARELHALVVLNGGTLLRDPEGPDEKPVPHPSIFVSPDFLRVLDPDYRRLVEIPVAAIRQIAIREDSNPRKTGSWRLEITCGPGTSPAACFRYEGVFAEHLARVAEKTLHEVWKKRLPVIAP
ncbi:MAG: hypothetical protein ACRD18_03695 [Terriglobia bacterium]